MNRREVACPICGPTPVTSTTGYVATCDEGHPVRGVRWVVDEESAE